MPLETATYISQLVAANPAHTDQMNLDDSHMRLIKSALLATFPNFTAAALASTQAQLDAAVASLTTGTIHAADGTVGAPTYSFGTDTGTGWYKSALHEASMAINGVQTGKWTTTGLDLLTFTLNLSAASHLTVGGVAVFPLQSANIGALQVLTAAIADANVTYGKIQNVGASSLLGNPTGAPAATSEVTLGAGLVFNGTTLTAPGAPVVGSYKNKKITVLTNTTVSVTADFLEVTDGTSTRRVVINSASVNLGSAGAIDQLATALTIAANTWYYVWGACKADGSLPGVVVGTSPTAAPTLPAGYTMSAYMGPLRTATATAQLLGSKQVGSRFQYVVGLAQTTTLPLVCSGVQGTWSATTPTYAAKDISTFAPSTAQSIEVTLHSQYNGGGVSQLSVAPNSNYGGFFSANPPPASLTSGASNPDTFLSMLLESTNISVAAAAGGSAVTCSGFTEID